MQQIDPAAQEPAVRSDFKRALASRITAAKNVIGAASAPISST
jgi:hypothetical protein